MKSKKLTGILIAAVIILLVCVVGTTFAYYFAVLRGQNENTISTSKATLILTEQDEANTRVPILKDEDGAAQGSLYDFTVSLTSNGQANIAYALYLEEAEGNTIDPSLIHINLTRDGDDLYDEAVGHLYNPEEMYCYNFETGENVEGSEGKGCSAPEFAELTLVETNTDTDGTQTRILNYYANITSYPFVIQDEDKVCTSTHQVYQNDEWVTIGRGSGDQCKYGTITPKNIYSFVGENSYASFQKEMYAKLGKMNGAYIKSKLEVDDFTNLIFMSTMYVDDDFQDNNHTYHLRYWLSEEEMAKQGTAEGILNDDGSVSAEIGEDAVFKFKIGVYAKSIQGS